MLHPEKWRETADPFAISFEYFKLQRISGYPHAGNDVFQVEGLWQGRPCRAFLKIARQPGADIPREAALLGRLQLPGLPRVLEWSAGEPAWLLTEELPGQRLSTLLGANAGLASLQYLPQYGRALANIHRQTPEAPPVADRRFFHLPPRELAETYGLQGEYQWLQAFPPVGETGCFVHGDFHYANLLWQDGRLTAMLDWELAGMGSREFDLAWAVFHRPGQRFFTTRQEWQAFLQGYDLPFSRPDFCRHLARIALWFFPMGDALDREIWEKMLNDLQKQ